MPGKPCFAAKSGMCYNQGRSIKNVVYKFKKRKHKIMKYKKIVGVFIIGIALLAGSAYAAQAAPAATGTAAAVSEADALPDAGITPLSVFYFLDRAADWAKVNFFFFNPVKKAEIAARVANERLAELKEVVEKAPRREDIIEKLENEVAERIGEAHGALERFGMENKKTARLMGEIENLSLNSQRVMEDMLLENIPEKMKRGTEASLKKIYGLAQKGWEMMVEQRGRGLISEEEAEEIMNERMERMKDQIERRAEGMDKIKDPSLREAVKRMMSEKLNLLEGDVFSAELMKEGESVREKAEEGRKRAIESILKARKRMMIRGAAGSDEMLREMYEGKMDFKDRSKELIERAEETIAEVEGKIGEAPAAAPRVIRSAKVLLETAGGHLAAAKKAFEAERYREAFGYAMAAARTSAAAERALEREDEAGEGVERAEEGERGEMDETMKEMREEGMKEMMEEKMERLEKMPFFKRGHKEREDKEEMSGKRERGAVCAQVYEPVCGEDGKTYSNKCAAEIQHGVKIKHNGKCRTKPNSFMAPEDEGEGVSGLAPEAQ